jgi:hypothetical protein
MAKLQNGAHRRVRPLCDHLSLAHVQVFAQNDHLFMFHVRTSKSAYARGP